MHELKPTDFSEPLILLSTPKQLQTKHRHGLHVAEPTLERHMLTYRWEHIHLVLGKQVQKQFIKAPSRSHYYTTIKSNTAVSGTGSVYEDVGMHEQGGVRAGFSISVGLDVYFPQFQFRRYKRKTLDLINLNVSRSEKGAVPWKTWTLLAFIHLLMEVII